MPFTGIEIVGILSSLFLTSGALAFFFRYGVRLALVEKSAKDACDDSKQNGKDIAATKERVVLVEGTLQDIRNSLSKLNSIDEIKANLNALKDTMTEHAKEHVPRSEQLARWEAQGVAMSDLKTQVADIREQLNK